MIKMQKRKLCFILGTRPEIIKTSPVIKLCQRQNLNFFIIHTGQHYSFNLDAIFLKELELPKPKYNLEVGSGMHGEQTGQALVKIESVLLKEKPDFVIVQGDTNSVLAGALAASKLHISIGHIEAGLRSYDRGMPEEINRVLTDHISNFLFAPTKEAKKNLLKEGIAGNKIFMTGNTIVDSVLQNLKLAQKKSKILEKLGLEKNKYFILTLHRPENVDIKARLTDIVKGLNLIAKSFDLPIIWPIHPRSQKNLRKFSLGSNLARINQVRLIKPVGFLDFLILQANARLTITDSGGVQEEACIIKVPCVTLRDNTERPESVEVGANTVAGVKPEKILQSVVVMMNKKRNWKNPFGDGKSAQRILKVITKI